MIKKHGNMIQIKNILLIQAAILLYSINGIFQKIASNYEVASLDFIFNYVVSIAILFLYALLWQRVLKKVPLSLAYSNKAVSVLWGMIWGYFLFREQITWNMFVGAIVIIIGVYLEISDEQ